MVGDRGFVERVQSSHRTVRPITVTVAKGNVIVTTMCRPAELVRVGKGFALSCNRPGRVPRMQPGRHADIVLPSQHRRPPSTDPIVGQAFLPVCQTDLSGTLHYEATAQFENRAEIKIDAHVRRTRRASPI